MINTTQARERAQAALKPKVPRRSDVSQLANDLLQALDEIEDWHRNIGRMVRHFDREPDPNDYTETIAQMSTGLGILRYEHKKALEEIERLKEFEWKYQELQR